MSEVIGSPSGTPATEAEVERLREEVARLEAERAGDPGRTAPAAGHRARAIGAGVLIVLATLLFAVAIPSVWFARTITNTDRYVATVGPLADDPTIQAAVAARTSEQIVERLGAEERLRELLPPDLQILAGPLAGGVESIVANQTETVVQSDEFSTLWREANRLGHAALMAAVTGREGVLSVDTGVVSLDLSPITSRVEERLADSRLADLNLTGTAAGTPDQIVLFESTTLSQVSSGLDLLQRVAWWLAFLAFGAAAVAVALATDRRRALLWIGVGLVIAGLVPLLVINLSRTLAVEPILGPKAADPEVPVAAYNVLVSGLVVASRAAIALGFVLALAMYLAGPSGSAVSFRTGLSRRLAGTGWQFGSFGSWVIDHRAALRIAGIVLAVILLLLANQPSAFYVIGLAIGLGLYLLALELPQRPPAAVEAGDGEVPG